jgi:hypothetical protein
MSPDHAAGDRRGSTSTMMSAIHVMKIAMIVQTAGLYPFLAASHAVSTTGTIHSTIANSSSNAPMFGMRPLFTEIAAFARGQVACGIRP